MMPNLALHSFNLKILREYDIRGTLGQTLSIADALLLGQRFGSLMAERGLKTIAVGRDGRLSSPELSHALIQGLTQTGIHVKDIGIGPTPLLYFAVKHLKTDAGIMVTGSHNPAQDNGFKITLADRPFFGADIQLLNLSKPLPQGAEGDYEASCVEEAYKKRLLQDYTPNNNAKKRLKVVWDPGNGAAGKIIQDLIDSNALDVDSLALNTTIDGTFPAHHPDPTVAENLEELIQTVKTQSYDLGIAFDGDADRIGVVDGQGRILWGDQLMIIWARDILASNPGATIIGDIKASQGLFDEIKNHGGNPIMAQTGHSLIKTKIAETKALLAGEMSGHIFFADRYYGFDDALYAAIRLLNILHYSPHSLAEIFDSLPHFYNTPEIRIPCAEEQKAFIIETLKQHLGKDKIPFLEIDGVRVNTEEGWWLVRASNTQAILVARCEAKTAAGLEVLKKQLQDYLAPFELSLAF